MAIVRYRAYRPLRSILVPVAGGPNSRRAARMAVNMAHGESDGPVRVTLLHVLPPGSRPADQVRARQVMDYALEGLSYDAVHRQTVEGTNVVDAVLEAAEGHDLIVIGATEEPLFKNLLAGNISREVARRAEVSVVVVKRRSSALHSLLRQTVLEPTTSDAGPDDAS